MGVAVWMGVGGLGVLFLFFLHFLVRVLTSYINNVVDGTDGTVRRPVPSIVLVQITWQYSTKIVPSNIFVLVPY